MANEYHKITSSTHYKFIHTIILIAACSRSLVGQIYRVITNTEHMPSIFLRSATKLASSRLFHFITHNPLPQKRTMAKLNSKFKLNTGAEIREICSICPSDASLLTEPPLIAAAIGFGTWQDKDEQEEAVAEALKAGYRHIDTARM